MDIKGFASLFHRPDLSGDIIEPSAFNHCLAQRKPRQIKMLYHHDVTKPIGLWEHVRVTDKGLWVEGQIVVQSRLGHDVAALIEAGAFDGLSIGFRAVRAKRNRAKQRVIQEIDLLEISLVTFPMQPYARFLKKTQSCESLKLLTQRIQHESRKAHISLQPKKEQYDGRPSF